MSGYEKGQIYKVVDVAYDLCYIGSTTEKLVKRFGRHRRQYRSYRLGKRGKITVFDIFDKYGIENCKIYWIEDYPCSSKKELEAREGEHIKNTKCVNKRIEGTTLQEYRERTRVKRREYMNQYYHQKKETICEKNTCECGTTLTKQHKARHKRSKQHQDWLKQQKEE